MAVVFRGGIGVSGKEHPVVDEKRKVSQYLPPERNVHAVPDEQLVQCGFALADNAFGFVFKVARVFGEQRDSLQVELLSPREGGYGETGPDRVQVAGQRP